MRYVTYAYITKPTPSQIDGFIRALAGHGIRISHLGKSDPPRRFQGSSAEVVSTVFGGTDLTDSTFIRDAGRKLDITIEIHNDARWTHSTISASSPDLDVLQVVADSAAAALGLFIAIRGVSGGGKDQRWEVVHVTESCPPELRSQFLAAS